LNFDPLLMLSASSVVDVPITRIEHFPAGLT